MLRIRILVWIACLPALALSILFQQTARAQQRDEPAPVGTRQEPKQLVVVRERPPEPRAASLAEPSPVVQSMIDQVDRDTLYRIVGELSGQWPVLLGGQPYTILTRHTYSGQAISIATRYAGQQLSSYGLAVEYHQWDDDSNPNVIGELTGRRHPETVYLLSAHLDSTSPIASSLAPGADDNASGSTAVLVIADILSQYSWDCTLRFALWTGEEQGLRGSQAYAQRAFTDGEQIAGVLNLDMIGWNSQGSEPGMELHASREISGSLAQAQLFSDVVSTYDLALVPEIVSNPTDRSDHASFWERGYPAILAIEDFSDDFNRYYHTTEDTIQKLDFGYMTELVQASLGTLVHASDCLVTGFLQGNVWDDGSTLPIIQAHIASERPLAPPAFINSDGLGYYTVTLPIGVYTVTATAVGYESTAVTHIEIITDTVTTQDFYLVSRPPILLPLVIRDD